LFSSIGDIGCSDAHEEGEEVGRGSESLGIDVAVAHAGEDGREEDGKGGERDVAGEVHELYLLAPSLKWIREVGVTYSSEPILDVEDGSTDI
jgi:hypothetical protein